MMAPLVRVYWANSSEFTDKQLSFLSRKVSLSPAEVKASNQFTDRNDAEAFLSFQRVRRLILADHLGVAPSNLFFSKNSNGKPSVFGGDMGAPLHFSSTYCNGGWAIAVTREGEVGLDAELKMDIDDCRVIAERYFSAAENAKLSTLREREASRCFLHAWTKKEALIKAKGGAISEGLDKFGTELLDCRAEQGHRGWRLQKVEGMDNSWICYIALKGGGRYKVTVKEINSWLQKMT